MTINIDDLAADATEQQALQPKKLSLQEIVGIAEAMQQLEGMIQYHEEQLTEIKKGWRNLAEKVLPEAMQQLGLSSLSLKDGSTIGITDVVAASIKEDNREAAHKWLRDNGYGDLIKNEVVAVFGKGEDDKANAVASTLLQQNIMVMHQEKVHPQTLNAQVRSWLKDGTPFPADIFKLYVGQQAKLNGPKVKK